jgi:hypothetical protein
MTQIVTPNSSCFLTTLNGKQHLVITGVPAVTESYFFVHKTIYWAEDVSRDSSLTEPYTLRLFYSNNRVVRNTSNSFSTKYIHTYIHTHTHTERKNLAHTKDYLKQISSSVSTLLTPNFPPRNNRCHVICAHQVPSHYQARITTSSLTIIHGTQQSALWFMQCVGKKTCTSMMYIVYNTSFNVSATRGTNWLLTWLERSVCQMLIPSKWVTWDVGLTGDNMVLFCIG